MNRLLIKFAMVLALALGSCQGSDIDISEQEVPEVAKGPHDGRLLTDGDFQTEVTIFERGVPPQFRVYCFENGTALALESVRMTIELRRIGGRTDLVQFKPFEDYLVGDQVVVEPHSFDVTVLAEYQGKSHRWEYDSYEGRTTMSEEAAQNSGIIVDTVGPAKIRQTIRVFGRIAPNEDRVKEIAPRFPGVVKEVRKRLGEVVAKDDVLAVVESNESLQQYEVKSGIAGTVILKNVTPGEYAKEGESIYTIADLSQVWVDLNVPRKDFDKLKIGQSVTVSAGDGTTDVQSTVSYISPFGAQDTQTMLARVELSNPDGRWRPGFFVVGEIIVNESIAPIAVKANALQTFRDWDVVFLRDADLFEIAILELGHRDQEWVEVISGLTPGQLYASENSFIIKADIGKSGASHDH